MNPYHSTALFTDIGNQKQLLRLFRRSLVLLLVLVMLISLASCTTTSSITDPKNQAGKKDGLVFVTSVYPLYLATAQIAKGVDKVTVHNLTEEITGCLHDYQLTTGNMKTLEKADVFIINGVGLESYLETVARDLPNLRLITAADGIEIVANNPHVWVSITNMIHQVETIAGQMGAIDSANKAAFDLNARRYIDQLTTLRQKMHESIDPLPERRIVTVHEAFTYFAVEFNLDIVGVIEREPDSEPSAAELANTIQLIRNKKVRAVFAEPQYSATAAQQIAEESGVRMYLLDPAASGDLKNLDAYLAIMEKNRQVLVEALR